MKNDLETTKFNLLITNALQLKLCGMSFELRTALIKLVE